MVNDLISRQAVIDRINKQREHLQPDIYPQDKIGDAAYRICAEFIERFPSAQPEIVRCKDCEHRDPEDKKCDCGHAILWQLPRQDDWYCADAERRTDEGD